MKHDWMIDVLSDLQTYALNHKMTKLSEQLEDSIMIAASDMAKHEQGILIEADDNKGGDVFRTISAS